MYEIYPYGKSSFIEYDDDGVTEAYREGDSSVTRIHSEQEGDKVTVTIEPTEGMYDGLVKERTTELRINVTQAPKSLSARIGKKNVKLQAVSSKEAFDQGTDVYYYEESPELNRFSTEGSEFASVQIRKNPVVHVKLHPVDVTVEGVQVEMKGFAFAPADRLLKQTGALQAPQARITDENAGAYTLTPTWEPVAGADYYEIESDGMIYSTIRQNRFTFEDLKAETDYSFRIRAVNASGASEWSSFSGKTQSDPLEFAIRGIKGETSCPNQPGQPVRRLFNFDETDAWHTEEQGRRTVRSHHRPEEHQYTRSL